MAIAGDEHSVYTAPMSASAAIRSDPPHLPGAPLAQEHVAVFASPDPQKVHAYSPGICRLPSGRLVATCDLCGPDMSIIAGPTGISPENGRPCQGRVYLSDDRGRSWRHAHSFPFMHARPFAAGGRVYVLGHAADLQVIRSDDDGATWSAPSRLSEGQSWHQAPCATVAANGCIYLTMERRVSCDIRSWYVGELAPVLMRAPLDADLTRRASWTFASELAFRDVIDARADCPQLDWHGVPFFHAPWPHGTETAPDRWCAPIGWLESNVVRITDPRHVWHDPAGRTLHLWLRAHTGGVNLACVLKVVEESPGRGAMATAVETAPSGKRMLYVPCPGGQMKFHIVQDARTGLYWLLSTQATDSMAHPARMAAERYNLPNNERRRLQLHVSGNLMDWRFAGMVAVGESERSARHYASMAIDGEDLVVLSRSGDLRAKSAHDGNLITSHVVRDFRALACC